MPKSLTEQNKASGKPPESFVRMFLPEHGDVWWTPAQARQFAAAMLESDTGPDTKALADKLIDLADAIER